LNRECPIVESTKLKDNMVAESVHTHLEIHT
jgi:hypothetical protein